MFGKTLKFIGKCILALAAFVIGGSLLGYLATLMMWMLR